MVISRVGVKHVSPAPRGAILIIDPRDAVGSLFGQHALLGGGTRQDEGKRGTVPVGDDMALRAKPASID